MDYDTVEAVVAAHEPDEFRQLDLIVEKVRAVLRGEDTFTQAQAQRLLAHLAIAVARQLR